MIGYDIHAAKQRRQTLKTLRALTACYQDSFFDCELTADELHALLQELTPRLDPACDGLIIAWLNPSDISALGHRWASGGQSLYLIT
jgi:CRISPR/Cas system-associated endoribonuclease Cas2